MGDTVTVIKTLIVPAVISLILFLLLTFVLVPIWRRYRNRYSQYLPLDAISSQTSSLRHRITARLLSLALPSTWRRDREIANASGFASSGRDLDDDEDDGEELDDVDQETLRVLERHAARSGRPDNVRRLSRELEEGFRDDSDEGSNEDSD